MSGSSVCFMSLVTCVNIQEICDITQSLNIVYFNKHLYCQQYICTGSHIHLLVLNVMYIVWGVFLSKPKLFVDCHDLFSPPYVGVLQSCCFILIPVFFLIQQFVVYKLYSLVVCRDGPISHCNVSSLQFWMMALLLRPPLQFASLIIKINDFIHCGIFFICPSQNSSIT